MSLLIMPISGEPAKIPYTFALTGINVYSFEEALYHVKTFWRESSEDIVSAEFRGWLCDDAHLPSLAAKAEHLSLIKSYTKRVVTFLTLSDYFSEEDIELISADISNWEREFEWENLKIRADYLLEQNVPERALILYKRANELFKSPALLNNTGIAYMKLYRFDTAVSYFEAAKEIDSDNLSIVLNMAEAAIYNHNFVRAAELLDDAAALCEGNPLIAYLNGEAEFEEGNFKEAAAFFSEAYEQAEKDEGNSGVSLSHIACRLADAYVKTYAFDKALTLLEKVNPPDKECYTKCAEVSALMFKLPAAIAAMERAIRLDDTDFSLHLSLARYCRLSNENWRAKIAIEKAAALAPDNGLVKLEYARIKKMNGGHRDYLDLLNEIADGFKREYREAAEI